MDSVNRRDFLKDVLVAGSALALGGSPRLARAQGRVLGANETINLGIIGMNNKGAQHITDFRKLPLVRVAALCDVDRAVLAREEEKFKARNEPVKTFNDPRKLLEDPGIDAVVIATPNHWHALLTVWACQAGKDVYVEKPVSYCIWEGGQMVKAARKHNRIVQAGTQRRSDPGMQEAVAWLRSGALGRITAARAIYYVKRESLGRVTKPQPAPATVDFNLWTGPAPLEPLMRKKLHYDWHWFWNTGNGDCGNNGIHFVDLCRWVVGQDAAPLRAVSFGGRYAWDDNGQTPNSQVAVWEGAGAPIVMEIRNLPRKKGDPVMDNYRGVRTGVVVECEGGYFAGGWAYDAQGAKIKQFPIDEGASHQANFIKALRSRKAGDLNAEILDGARSAALCHLANISWRTGQAAAEVQLREALGKNAVAAEAFERHLGYLKANEIPVDAQCATLGSRLRFVPESDDLLAQDAATTQTARALRWRTYREPFVLHEEV